MATTTITKTARPSSQTSTAPVQSSSASQSSTISAISSLPTTVSSVTQTVTDDALALGMVRHRPSTTEAVTSVQSSQSPSTANASKTYGQSLPTATGTPSINDGEALGVDHHRDGSSTLLTTSTISTAASTTVSDGSSIRPAGVSTSIPVSGTSSSSYPESTSGL